MKHSEYYTAIKDPILVQHNISEKPINARFHVHDDYEIYLFLSGDVEYYLENHCHAMKRGHLAVTNDKEIHRVHYLGKQPYERYVVHFNPRLVQSLSTANTNLLSCFHNHLPSENNIVQVSEEQLPYLIHLYETLFVLSKSDKYGDDIMATVYLAQLLVEVNRIFIENKSIFPSPVSNFIGSILTYIDDNLSSDLTLEKVAHHFSIDRSYLSHTFKKKTGNTLYQYILMKKISTAKQLLLAGKTVTETCTLAGFNDYNNFIRTFRQITGTSPGKYNKSQ